jgi:hypothetical protein
MRWLGLTSLLLVFASGCGKQERRAHEGVYCSHMSEDPMFVCNPAFDLVCITTNRHINPNTGALGPEQYLCRLPCSPGDSCPEQGVCCPGKIYGKDFGGKTHACVPYSFCADPPVIKRDGGSDAPRTDAGSGTDGGPEAGSDATAADGGDGAAPASDGGEGDAPADMGVSDAAAD